MRRARWTAAVTAAVVAGAALAAAPPGEVTGTTGDDPLVEDVCPEAHPELDPADPIGTLSAPEPAPEHDLCAAWVTAEWRGTGPSAELRSVTFGLRTLGDVALRPDRSYGFSWRIPTDLAGVPLLPDDGTCGAILWVTDGTVLPRTSFRTCGTPTLWYWPGERVQADLVVDGPVLEVRMRPGAVPAALAASLASGATLWSFAAESYRVEPWTEDAARGGDVTFAPPGG